MFKIILLPILTISYPILLFHGLGDSCLFPGMKNLVKIFENIDET
jgi:hypothetical protein